MRASASIGTCTYKVSQSTRVSKERWKSRADPRRRGARHAHRLHCSATGPRTRSSWAGRDHRRHRLGRLFALADDAGIRPQRAGRWRRACRVGCDRSPRSNGGKRCSSDEEFACLPCPAPLVSCPTVARYAWHKLEGSSGFRQHRCGVLVIRPVGIACRRPLASARSGIQNRRHFLPAASSESALCKVR